MRTPLAGQMNVIIHNSSAPCKPFDQSKNTNLKRSRFNRKTWHNKVNNRLENLMTLKGYVMCHAMFFIESQIFNFVLFGQSKGSH